MLVHPGDIVVADGDGVIVVPLDLAEDWLTSAPGTAQRQGVAARQVREARARTRGDSEVSEVYPRLRRRVRGYRGGHCAGEMLLETIEAAIQAHDVQTGRWCLASAPESASMHHIQHDPLPPEDRFFTIEKPLEVSNISGIVADGKAHLHMTVGYRDEWALAGHLEPGSEVLYLAEVVLLKFNGLQLDRHYDEERKIKLLGAKR